MIRDRPILILAISQTLAWAGIFYLFPATLLRWETDLGWPKPDLTLAVTLAVLCSAIGSPLAGKLIDRGHGPMVMGAATATSGLALCVLSQIIALWQFYSLWIIIGFAQSGSLYDACFALVTRARGAQARDGIVRITLIAGFAGTISFPSMHILGEALGWRGAVLMVGLLVVVIVAPLQWLGARALHAGSPVAPITTGSDPARGIWLRPEFWLLGTGLAMLALVHGATLHHLLPLLSERELPLEFAVLIAALIGPMQVLGRLLMLALQNRIDSHVFMLIAFGLMATAVAVLALAGNSKWAVGGFVLLFGSAWGMVSVLRPVIARATLGQDHFGANAGYLALLFLTAAAASAYLGALIWNVGGYGAMLTVQFVLCLLGARLFVMARRHVPS